MKEYNDELWQKLEKEYSSKNDNPFSKITPGSHKIYQWICENHEETYSSSAAARFRGQNCHYCSNNKILVGYNDLATKHPEFLQEWDYEKNDITPQQVQPKSSKKAWWICQKGHSYHQHIYKHTDGRKCPYCAGRKVLEGFNNIENENLIKEWDKKLNSKTISEYTNGSNHIAYWICPLNHSYKASIYNRTQRNYGCPYCSGRKVLQGFNDLKSQAPEILKEWDYEKNDHLEPTKTTYKSTKKAWFKCSSCHHEWRTPIYNRSVLKTGCSQCAYNVTVSKGELELREFVRKIVNVEIEFNNRTILHPMEIDIHIPSLRIGIEYNGDYWHSEEKIQQLKNMSAVGYHCRKIIMAKQKDVLLLMVWEDDWKNNTGKVQEYLKKVFHSSNEVLSVHEIEVPSILAKTESDII